MLHVTVHAPLAVRPTPDTTIGVPDASDSPPAATTVVAATAPRAGSAQADDSKPAPLSWRIGGTDITPVGFMDLTSVVRDGNIGSSIATNFGAVPLSNTVNGQLRDYRFSSQNSRLGLRLDSKPYGMSVLGYLETDFQGLVPGNVAVSSNSDTERLRLFWVNLRKSKLGAAGRPVLEHADAKPQGALPAAGRRLLHTGRRLELSRRAHLEPQSPGTGGLHANETVALGVSVEASDQYGGGSSGAGTVTLPSALVPWSGPQLNTGGSSLTTPVAHQDNIVKVAFDPKVGDRALHGEIAGLLSRFAFYNPLTDQHHDAAGGGVAAHLSVDVVKNLRLFAGGFYSQGGGRWIFGLGPDLVIRGDGSPSLVQSASTLEGVENTRPPRRDCSTAITALRISTETS